MKSNSYKYFFLVAILFGASFLLHNSREIFIDKKVLLNIDSTLPSWYLKHYSVQSEEIFTIKTEGCTIPGMKPLDDAIKSFVGYPKTMSSCPNAHHPLLKTNKTHIWVSQCEMKQYNVTEKELHCCYKSFYRPDSVDDVWSGGIDDRIKYGPCSYFSDTIEVKDEFVRVSCNFEGKKVYDQYFVFPHLKHIMLYDGTKEIPKNKSSYNVLILGIDNLSRLNFHRTMPKTLAYIKKKGAVELLGYNKVGSNSYPNLVAMLGGYRDSELEKICYQHRHATFDFCPFMWTWFKRAGYYTAFGEDSSYLGTFNYLADGFFRTPTDYYFHPFVNEAEKNVGANTDWSSPLCMQDKFFFQVLLDYIEEIALKLKSSRLFGFFWEVSMSHDYLNYPMVMDDSYEAVLKRWDASKYLDESIIFLVSDHGMRWGGIRSTKQGRLEERLPFVYVLTPKSFRKNYSEAFNNLKLNSRRLTTPFNVHETLNDLINLENIKNNKIISRSKESYSGNRGISLFLPIPRNRTCKIAGIDDHWCTCHRSSKVSKTSKEVIQAASYLIKHLNSLLREHSQCARLSLAEVLETMEMMAGKPEGKESGWREYMVVVRTTPGDGIFEATLRYDSRNWTLAGAASRLNLYGNQSRCVHHPQLKLYCYCQ